MNKREILDFYLKQGFAIIPLLPMEKRPALESWVDYQKRKPTIEEIDGWFGNGKLEQRNMGAIQGHVSGNKVVLDFDKKELLDKIKDTKLYEYIQKTLKVKTSKGLHAYFESNVPIASGKRDYGLDIKGEGGYVVCAGSTHPDGTVYSFANDSKDIIKLDNLEVLIKEIDDRFQVIKPAEDLKQQIAKELMGVGEGARNNAAVRIADFYIHYLKWTPEQTADFLIKYWNPKNTPPIPENELLSCVKSAQKRQYWSKKITDEIPLQAYGGPLLLAEYVLNQTIKSDRVNKLLTFLGELSTFTKDSQLSMLFKSDSSTGKSHIALKVADLFPQENIIELAGASATAFFHEFGKFSCPTHKQWTKGCDTCNNRVVDFNNKILVFIDQPSDELLDKIKPLLSHDRYELVYKITDKLKHGGLRTKTIILRGWPSVVFCTAKLWVQEEQSTRSFILSAEETQEKLGNALQLVTDEAKKTPKQLEKDIESDLGRKALREYILTLIGQKVNITIPDAEQVLERFRSSRPRLTARHQRDYKRLLNLIKIIAFFNKTDRVVEKDGNGEETLYATPYDIELAYTLFDPISEANELGLSPSILEFYNVILLPLWDQNPALEYRQVQQQFRAYYRKPLNVKKLKEVMLPMLESAGLLYIDKHPTDPRKNAVYKQNGVVSGDKQSIIYTTLTGAPPFMKEVPPATGVSIMNLKPEEILVKYLKSGPKLENDLYMHMSGCGVPKSQTERLISKMHSSMQIYAPKEGYWQAI